jgi:hypothetical protein
MAEAERERGRTRSKRTQLGSSTFLKNKPYQITNIESRIQEQRNHTKMLWILQDRED